MGDAMDTAPPGEAPIEKKRLMIREMVLENFKSYAGAQHVGPFHKSFSAVVGPNGSGKSNVIDAMLFVFGRRAKQLRFNKISELIHNSANHRNCESARVTVHFHEIIDREGDAYDIVPGSAFSVARTANRANTSDYYLDAKRVPPKEVVERLKAKGIDLDNNRFLILQGEVEQIAMMKPKAEDKNDTGLLEYLEDIIGTDKYVAPIEENAKKLEELNEKRQGLVQRLKVAEKEKDGLESKKNEAEDYNDRTALLRRTRLKATQRTRLDTQAQVVKDSATVSELEGKLAHEQEKHASIDTDAKAREAAFDALEKRHTAVAKALEKASEAVKGFVRQDTQIAMDLKHVEENLKKTSAKGEKDAKSIETMERDAKNAEADLPFCASKIERLNAELASAEASLEAILEDIKGEVEGYHRQLSEVRSELAPWEKRMGEVASRLSVAAAERDMLLKRSEDAKRRLEAALKSLETAKATAFAKEKQIKELEESASNCGKQIEAHKAELNSAKAQERGAADAVGGARDRVATLRADVSATAQQGGLVAALMEAKARGEVSGVYGRLGDLGAIDKAYDVAVSTAVGALDYIVVETAVEAQKCVEYLRRCNLGVATFLILEKQKHLERAANEKVKAPEGAPRLYDLIKIKEPCLRPAFYFAFSNTLVAQDLETASSIAYARGSQFRRVVTLGGQLIAESGTMSGGGGRPSRGRMALGAAAPRSAVDAKAAQAELRSAEGELEAASAALKGVRDRVAAVEGALRAAERQLGELETSVPKARMEAEAEAAKAADIKARLDELRAATQVSSDDETRVAELGKEIASEEKAKAELRKQTSGLEAKAAALSAKIDGAGGEKLAKAKACVAKLSKDISDTEAEAARKAVQVKANAKSVDKLKKEAVKAEAEVIKLTEEVKRLEEAAAGLEDSAFAAAQEEMAATEAVAAAKAELDAARSARDDFLGSIAIIQKTALSLEKSLADACSNRDANAKYLKSLDAEVSALIAQLSEASGSEEKLPSEEDLAGTTLEDLKMQIYQQEHALEKLNPDMQSIEEYRAKEAEYLSRAAEVEGVTGERDTVRRDYEGLRKRRLDEFMHAFNIISMKLKEMYQMITLGGDAELEPVDSHDPFLEGIVFSVRPPRKSWKNISNLSGGEKTLSSLSLVFALHHFKPTPLYVMDEIDAALDFKNVSIVGHYIKDRTKDAQFVIISLRNNMFELADRLVGIYKTDNSTKTVTINPAEFTVGAPAVAAAGAGNGGAKAGAKNDTAAAMDQGQEDEQEQRDPNAQMVAVA